MDNGITFGGKHSEADFGLIYIADAQGGRTVTPTKTVNEYAIAGSDGTVRYEGESYQPYQLRGALYPMVSPHSEAEASVMLRTVSAWLTGGRQKLIFDYEPGIYYWAEVTQPVIWTHSTFCDGGIEVVFDVQPMAYSVDVSRAEEDTEDGEADVTLTVDTGRPAPLCAAIENTGDDEINEITVTTGAGLMWHFDGLGLEPGAVLEISQEMPVAARVLEEDSEFNAFPYAARFDTITASGTLALHVACDGDAHVEFTARGRWA